MTTRSGPSTVGRRVPRTRWPRRAQIGPRRPTGRRPPTTSFWTTCPPTRERRSAAGRRRTPSSVLHAEHTRPGPTQSKRTSGRCGSSPSPTPITSCRPGPCTPICAAGATRSPSPRRAGSPAPRARSYPQREGHPLGRASPCRCRLTSPATLPGRVLAVTVHPGAGWSEVGPGLSCPVGGS